MSEGIMSGPPAMPLPSHRTIPVVGPPVGLVIRSAPPVVSMTNRMRWWPPQGTIGKPATEPPPGNIGNCQGQITVTYYVYDSPVVEP